MPKDSVERHGAQDAQGRRQYCGIPTLILSALQSICAVLREGERYDH